MMPKSLTLGRKCFYDKDQRNGLLFYCLVTVGLPLDRELKAVDRPRLAQLEEATQLIDLYCKGLKAAGLGEGRCEEENRATFLVWLEQHIKKDEFWVLDEEGAPASLMHFLPEESEIVSVVTRDGKEGKGYADALIRSAQRLSWLSSGLPWFLVSDDSVKDGEEFPCNGDEGGFLWLPGGGEAVIEALQDGVEPCRDHRGHEQSGAHARPASRDEGFAAPLPGLPSEGTKADQRGDLLAVQVSKLGQFSDESVRGGWADAGNGGEKLLVRPPQWGLLDGRIDIAVEA